MIYNDDHLEITLTKTENGSYVCDKTIEEIQSAHAVYGIAQDKDIKLKIRFVDGIFEGLGYIDKDGVKLRCLTQFFYRDSTWHIKKKTLEEVS